MQEIFVCECSSAEHQIVFDYDKEDNLVYCHIHLANHSLWNRIKQGIKYILGYKCRYGHWDEFIWKIEHADKLLEIGNKLKQLEKDQSLLNWYLKGFKDELNGTTSNQSEDSLENKAYTLGAINALVGGVRSVDYKSNEQILIDIKNMR